MEEREGGGKERRGKERRGKEEGRRGEEEGGVAPSRSPLTSLSWNLLSEMTSLSTALFVSL